MKWFFVLLQAVNSLKVELVKFCLLSMSLNILIILHAGILCTAQSHAAGKTALWLEKVFEVEIVPFFYCLVFQEQMKTGPEETQRAQTLLSRGLETWRIKIMGEVLFKWLIEQSERGSKAGQESVWRTSSSFSLQSVRWKLPLLSK